jgi:hypothetical protein
MSFNGDSVMADIKAQHAQHPRPRDDSREPWQMSSKRRTVICCRPLPYSCTQEDNTTIPQPNS